MTLHGSYLHRCSPGTPTDQDSPRLGRRPTPHKPPLSAVARSTDGSVSPLAGTLTRNATYAKLRGALLRGLRGVLPGMVAYAKSPLSAATLLPTATRRTDGRQGNHLTLFPTDTDAKTQEQSTPKKKSPYFPVFNLLQTSAVRCCEALMEVQQPAAPPTC